MNSIHPTGLGEPQPFGKRSLFQPPPVDDRPAESEIVRPEPIEKRAPARQRPKEPSLPRLRTTIMLSRDAFQVIQKIQENYRLETGKVLPLWKVVSRAIEDYGRKKGRDAV